MFHLDFARAQFPALDTPWALLDNAGGSAPCRQVIERVTAHLSRVPVQLGASYELSRRAGAAVDEGRRAAAKLLGATAGELIFGSSSTVLLKMLAQSLRRGWQAGDEVVVTNLDHEANIGPWRALEETGIVVREWHFRPETARLELEDLEPLLGERTRLVAFTHCSNIVGSIHDVAKVAARLRERGVLSCVDGVAYAPHRRVDVAQLGVDFYCASLYKIYGPHLGVLFGRRELLQAAAGPNHFFISQDSVPSKFEPGNPSYELAAGVVGIVEYLEALAVECGVQGLTGAFEVIARQEALLAEPLLHFLNEHERVELFGEAQADARRRVPTVAFRVRGMASSALPPLLDERQVAIRFGHFYAYRAIRDVGWLDSDGIVRVSLLHYNTPAEVERLIEGLQGAMVRS